MAHEDIYVDKDGVAHDDEGNSWFVGLDYAGGHYKYHQLPPDRSHQTTSRPMGAKKDLEELAEVAGILKDPKGADFLRQMARARYAPTDKQRAYLESLRKRYESKLPMLAKLRADAERERQKADRERQEAARQEAQEEKELADLGRELRREGWRQDTSWANQGFYYEEPPYSVAVVPSIDNYDLTDGWIVNVTKDGRQLFHKAYRLVVRSQSAELAEKAKDTAIGVVERDKRQNARTAPVEAPKVRNEGHTELLGRVRRLGEAATAAQDDWLVTFTKSIAFQLTQGKTLSEKQMAVLEKSFKRHKVASLTQEKPPYTYNRATSK